MRSVSRPILVLWAACTVLFLSIGARQGFGLLMEPMLQDPGLTRTEFSAAVATQYLVWGLVGPLAGMAADIWGTRRTLVLASFLYAAGFAVAAYASTNTEFLLGAGFLIGAGIGCASFGVVHAAVARVYPEQRRATALGVVGGATTLGQLCLLLFTDWSVESLGWRDALLCHAALVCLVAPAAFFLGSGKASNHCYGGENDVILFSALQRPYFWMLAVPFAFSGFQVMATMTHLPAYVEDLGLTKDSALLALLAVSASAFAGSWMLGYLADRTDKALVLAFVYAVRVAITVALLIVPPSEWSLVLIFVGLGLVWMSPIPLTSAVCAQLFGTRWLASVFSLIFFFHQLGGFVGTWLAGVIRESQGKYDLFWYVSLFLCAFGAVTVLLLWQRKRSSK